MLGFFGRGAVRNVLFLVVATGCSNYDASKATRIDAFGPEESDNSRVTEANVNDVSRHGAVIQFHQGDILTVKLQVKGEVLELIQETPMKLQVKRKLYVYSHPSGLLLSKDGVHFEPISRAIKGSLKVGLAVTETTRSNDLKIEVSANLRSGTADFSLPEF